MSLGCFPHFFQQKVQVLNKNKTKNNYKKTKNIITVCTEARVHKHVHR